MQLYTDVGTQRCGAIHGDVGLWEHRAVGLYSCGTLSLYIYISASCCFSTGSQYQNLWEAADSVGEQTYRQTHTHRHTEADRRPEMRAK